MHSFKTLKSTCKHFTSLTLIAALTTSIACGPEATGGFRELDTKTDTQTLHAALKAPLMSAAHSVKFLNDSTFVAQGNCALLEEGEVCQDSSLDFDLSDQATQVTDMLAQLIFHEDNIDAQASTPTKIVYTLRADNVCKNDSDVVDTECADLLTKFPVSFAVTSSSENRYLIAISVRDPAPILEFEVQRFDAKTSSGQDSIGVYVSLAPLKKLYTSLYTEFNTNGQEPPFGDFDLSSFEGKVLFQIAKLGSEHVNFTYSVVNPIKIAAEQDNKEVFSLEVASPHISSIEINNTEKKLSTNINFGAIKARALASLLELGASDSAQEPIAGMVEFLLPSFKSEVDFNINASDQDNVVVKNLSMGQLSITHDDNAPFLTSEIIPASRAFPIHIEESSDNTTNINMGNGIEFKLGMHLQHALALLGKEVAQEQLKSEDLSVKFSSPNNVSLQVINDQIKVLMGSLTLHSNNIDAPVVVEANQCLLAPTEDPSSDDGTSEEAHPFSLLSAGACE